jgi:hypothetical protein
MRDFEGLGGANGILSTPLTKKEEHTEAQSVQLSPLTTKSVLIKVALIPPPPPKFFSS